MRTKALLAAAAFAAGLAASMAQNVYSLNVVGYYNITIPPNSFALIANQLNTTNNTLNNILPSVPDFTPLWKFSNGSYVPSTFLGEGIGWDPDLTLNPGEGAFIKNVTDSPMTITFVGEVLQGSLTNQLPAGFSIVSSMVPVAGTLNDLGVPGDDFDQAYKFASGSWTTSIYVEGWLDAFSVDVGEAFFLKRQQAGEWVREFTVE